MKCYGLEFEVYNHDVNVYRIRCKNVWWVRLKKSCHAIWGLVYDRIYDLLLIISFENRRRAGGISFIFGRFSECDRLWLQRACTIFLQFD